MPEKLQITVGKTGIGKLTITSATTLNLPVTFSSGEEGKDSLEQVVCDYIAGMTDTYAVRKFKEIYVPGAWVFPEVKNPGAVHEIN